MATLPTNYVDDQLAQSMGGRRHYNMTTDAYGTYLTDVTEYTQRGSTFAAAQINETNTQVNQNTSDIATKQTKTGDTKDNTTTFVTGDTSDSSATSWTTVTQLTSGLSHATLLNRISTMMKNVRYLYNQVKKDGTTMRLTPLNSITISANGVYRGYFYTSSKIPTNAKLMAIASFYSAANIEFAQIYDLQYVSETQTKCGVCLRNISSTDQTIYSDGTTYIMYWFI